MNVASLRNLLISLFFSAGCLSVQSEQPKTPSSSQQVIFVCEHGVAKSVIAAAHFNKLAQQRGLPYRAIARGTTPDENYSPLIAAALQKDGLKAPEGKPQKIATADVKRSAEVVTLGCKLPDSVTAGNVRDWADVPPPSKGYEATRDEIVRHVDALLTELSK